jgi:hypothetical protein
MSSANVIPESPRATRFDAPFLDSPAESLQFALNKAQRSGEPVTWTSIKPKDRDDKDRDAIAVFTRKVGDFPIKVVVEANGKARVDIKVTTGGAELKPSDFTPAELQQATVGLHDWVASLVKDAIAALPKKPTLISAARDTIVDHMVSKKPGLFGKLLGQTEPPPAKIEQATDYEAEKRGEVIEGFETLRGVLTNIVSKWSASTDNADYKLFCDNAEVFSATLGQAIRATEFDQGFVGTMRLSFTQKCRTLANELADPGFGNNAEVVKAFSAKLVDMNQKIGAGFMSGTSAKVAGKLFAVAGTTLDAATQAAKAGPSGAVNLQSVLSLRSTKSSSPASADDLERIATQTPGGCSMGTFLSIARDVLGWAQPDPYNIFPKPKTPGTPKAGPEALFFYADPDSQTGKFCIRNGVDYFPTSDQVLRDAVRTSGDPAATVDAVTSVLNAAADQIEGGVRAFMIALNPAGEQAYAEMPRTDLFFELNGIKGQLSVEQRKLFQTALADAGFPMPIADFQFAQAPGRPQAPAAPAVAAPYQAPAPVAAAAPGDVLGSLMTAFADASTDAHAIADFLGKTRIIMGWQNDEPYPFFKDPNQGPQNLCLYAGGFAWHDGTTYTAATNDVLVNSGVTPQSVAAGLQAPAQNIEKGLRAYFAGIGDDASQATRAQLLAEIGVEAANMTDAKRQVFIEAMAQAGFAVQ